ncbi:MAG: hypothetical protein ABSG53_12950 [Thermoguttaceae bacterium]|jgi:alkylated DNA nucleotide flippase Atl1
MPSTEDLIAVLEQCVPPGSVTTYAMISLWGYGVPTRNQPVRAMLTGARNAGRLDLTNRVVCSDGSFADLPDGSSQQRDQLQREGIPLTAEGNVDFMRTSAVDLRPENAVRDADRREHEMMIADLRNRLAQFISTSTESISDPERQQYVRQQGRVIQLLLDSYAERFGDR